MPESVLSPDFALTMCRIVGPQRMLSALILHSERTSWLFDPTASRLDGPEACVAMAVELGLHEVPDPFGDVAYATDRSWRVSLDEDTGAVLHGPHSVVIGPLTAARNVPDYWRDIAIANGSTCRLLLITGVRVDATGDGDAYVTALHNAGAGRNIAGATIPVALS